MWHTTDSATRQQIRDQMSRRGALLETSSPSMFVVDLPALAHAQPVAGLLQELENAGLLIYETGRS